jgi:serine/threonine protein kinase
MHQDLKLSNVLVSKNLNVKICDFGVSQQRTMHIKSCRTTIKCVKGRPIYISSGCILKKARGSASSDIWSWTFYRTWHLGFRQIFTSVLSFWWTWRHGHETLTNFCRSLNILATANIIFMTELKYLYCSSINYFWWWWPTIQVKLSVVYSLNSLRQMSPRYSSPFYVQMYLLSWTEQRLVQIK